MAIGKPVGMSLLALVLGAALLSCRTPAPETGTASVQEAAVLPGIIAALVPDGWELVDPVSEFTPGTLYEKINGHAELFLSYDVVGLTFAAFANADDPGQFIDLFVYDMGNPTNGFGVYSVERSEGEASVNLGRSAYDSDGSHFVWKGQYYLQVLLSENTGTLRRLSRDLAAKITNAVHDTGERVRGLSSLPAQDRVDGSVRFYLVDALGLDFMTDTYTADYEKDGNRVKLFLSSRSSAASAASVIDQYRGYAAAYGNGCEDTATEGISLVVCRIGGRYDVVFQKGAAAGGTLSVKDRSLALRTAVKLRGQLGPSSP